MCICRTDRQRKQETEKKEKITSSTQGNQDTVRPSSVRVRGGGEQLRHKKKTQGGGQGMKDGDQPLTVSGESRQSWSAPSPSIWPGPESLTPDKPLSLNYQGCGTDCPPLTVNCSSENRTAKPLMMPSHSWKGHKPREDRFMTALKKAIILAEKVTVQPLYFASQYSFNLI